MSSIDAASAGQPTIAPAVAVEPFAMARARWSRQASRSTALGIVARAASIGARLATIPLAMYLLGAERYGLWLSVGSLLAWVNFAGPGLSYGLINAVSDASGRDDRGAIRQHVSTTVFTLAAAALLLVFLLPVLSVWSGWAALLGVNGRPELASEAAALIAVAGALAAVSFAFEFVSPLCAGLQNGYLASIASSFSSVLTVTGVLALTMVGGDLIAFALVTGLAPIVASVGLAAYLFGRRYPEFRPSWRLWTWQSVVGLLGFGGWMLVMHLADLAIFQSANVLIASRFGPGEVPRYAVLAAIFFNISQVTFLIVQPYWPAMREASVRQDWWFVRATMMRTLKMRLAMMGAAVAVIGVAAPPFIQMWVGEQAVPPQSLLVAMSVYYLFVTISGNYAVLLLGLGFVRLKALMSLAVGAAHVAGFFLLSPFLGLSAIPVAGAAAVLAESAVAAYIADRAIAQGIAREALRATA